MNGDIDLAEDFFYLEEDDIVVVTYSAGVADVAFEDEDQVTLDSEEPFVVLEDA